MNDYGFDPARVGSTYVVIWKGAREIWIGPFGYTHDAAQWASERLGDALYEVRSDRVATKMAPSEYLMLESIPA